MIITLVGMVYQASPSCNEPLVYFDCATASPGETGVECAKTCGNIDMPPCVSNNAQTHTQPLTEV